MNDFENLLVGTTLRRKFDDEFPDDEYVTDIDWYRTELEAGKIYEFTVMPETAFYAELSLYNQGGQSIQNQDIDTIQYEGLGIKTYFRPEIAGYYFSKVYDPLEESSGYYNVSATEIVDLPAYTNTPARLREYGFYDREIQEAGDSDWFRIDLVADRTYQFHIAGSSFSQFSLDDPFLRIYDEDANLLAYNNDRNFRTKNPFLNFTAPSTSTFFCLSSGSRRGCWNLSNFHADAG